MTAVLRGPADPDAFRVKVGRYKERWYHDPLPACPIAPATEDAWPSASAVKGAWPKYLTTWAAREAATCAVNDANIWKPMPTPAAVEYIAKASDRTRDRSAQRGTAIHSILENLLLGRQVPDLLMLEAADWVPAIKAFVEECRPELLLSEAVCISRSLGVGGTADAGLRIKGRNYFVDFKSRALDKSGRGKHEAYDDEAAQLGLYTQPDAYMIVDVDGRPARQRLPEFDGGLIITIAPDGYVLHPVELGEAQALARSLHGFWLAMRTSPVGKPVYLSAEAPASAGQGGGGQAPAESRAVVVDAAPAPVLRSAIDRVRLNRINIRTRIGELDQDAVIRLRAELDKSRLTTLDEVTDDELETYVACLRRVETSADLDDDDPFVGLPGPDGPIQPKAKPDDELLTLIEKLATNEDQVADLTDGLDRGVIGVAYTPAGAPCLATTPLAETAVLFMQGTKAKALTAAKALAKAAGTPAPRSVAQALEDPLIAARLARRAS